MSEGMICSLEELGIEDTSEGIAIIDEEIASKYKLGTSGALLLDLNDYIYDLAITANRPDGMSVIGIAREISALLETKLNFPELKIFIKLMFIKILIFVMMLFQKIVFIQLLKLTLSMVRNYLHNG